MGRLQTMILHGFWNSPTLASAPRLGSFAFSLLLLGSLAVDTRAAELVMFESAICEWCDAWNEEVGEIYDRTAEGKLAPLRRVPLHDSRPADLADLAPVRFTPTFVLVEDGAELGRIVGYPGESHFWGLLNEIIERELVN